jgi:hypothetical protein
MTETAEELAAEHTRRELEGMAEELGIETIGIGTKVHLAAAIIKAKETPKPKVEVKARVKPAIGKKGVLAKRAAIDAQIKENEKAVVVIGAGVREIQNGIKDMRSAMDNKAMEMHKSINVQIKANEKAAAKMDAGVKEMHRGIGAQIKENEKAAVKMNAGVKELQNGIREHQNETANYIKDFYYG